MELWMIEGRIQFIVLNQQKIWNWEAPNSGVGSSTSQEGKWKCCETGRTIFRPYPILGDPGAVSPAGEKGATKVLKQKPLGTDPRLTISKRLSECWLLIGHKKCFIIVPNRRTPSPEFFACVRTRLLLSRHSVLYLSAVWFVQGCACKGNFHFLLY